METNLKITEVAELIRATPQTVRNLVRRGYFPRAYKIDPTRPNSHLRIPAEDVQAYLKRIQPPGQ